MADASDGYPNHEMTEGWRYYNDDQARRQASGQSSRVIVLRTAEMSLRTTITDDD